MARPSSYYDAAQMERGTYSPSTSGRHPLPPSQKSSTSSPYTNRGAWDYYPSLGTGTGNTLHHPSQQHQHQQQQQQTPQRQVTRMPSTDTHLRQAQPSVMTPHHHRRASQNSLGRSVSISGFSDISSPTLQHQQQSHQNRMAYSPATASSSNNSTGVAWSPPYRTSPAASVASAPPQSGMMRRGQSYDSNAMSTSNSMLGASPISSSSQQQHQQQHFLLPDNSSMHAGPSAGRPLSYAGPSTSSARSPSSSFSASFASSSQSHFPPSVSPTSAPSLYAHHIPGGAPPPPPPAQFTASPSFAPEAVMSVSHNGSTPSPNPAAVYYAGGDQQLRAAAASIPIPPSPIRQPSDASSTVRTRRQKGLERVRDPSQIRYTVNVQPPNRRADPRGGFISPLKSMTMQLPQTYSIVNPTFRYESSLNPRRVLTKPSKPAGNDGYDNEDSDYILYVNDILGPEDKSRYLILDVLGQGTFGQVVKCQNIKTHEVVAVKVVKNKPAYFQQSMMEVTILELINNQWDKDDEHHMLRLKDTFIHRSHLCLVFELLSNNLYELIKQNSFRGLSTSLVRVFTTQLLDALAVLDQAKIIHCDLKPENILLKSLQSPSIKVIDFGSACHEKQTVYTYIQSRFYRSPEVILSLPYSTAIDMWSLGCICVELFLGLPLFPGTSEYNQISRIVEMLGMPPQWMLDKGKQTSHFFEATADMYGQRRWRLKSIERYSQEYKAQEQPSKKYFSATTLPEIIKQYPILRKGLKEAEIDKEMRSRVAFVDFVQGLLNLDPEQRWSPQQARLHPFVVGEPLLQPFVPPPQLKHGSKYGAQQAQAAADMSKRGYNGMPPSSMRNVPAAGKVYQDPNNGGQLVNMQPDMGAAAAAQAQMQAAQRATMASTAYQGLPDPYRSQQAAAQGPPPNLVGPGSFGAYPRINVGTSGALPVANPPAVHYTTRGRSNTNHDLPPQLRELGHNLLSTGAGQSITPVLRRDDMWQAWEQLNNPQQGGQGQRRMSISRHPHLSLLQEQAEKNTWQSPMTGKTMPAANAYGSYYQSPVVPSQPFSIVVDGRDRSTGSDMFDASPVGGIAPPPAAYGASMPNGSQVQQRFGGSNAPYGQAYLDSYEQQQQQTGQLPYAMHKGVATSSSQQPYFGTSK